MFLMSDWLVMCLVGSCRVLSVLMNLLIFRILVQCLARWLVALNSVEMVLRLRVVWCRLVNVVD